MFGSGEEGGCERCGAGEGHRESRIGSVEDSEGGETVGKKEWREWQVEEGGGWDALVVSFLARKLARKPTGL